MDPGDAEAALEAFDPDRFVSLFFVPRRCRRDVLALYSLELEVSRIATQVREPMIAQIRYAWWRDQIDALYAGRSVTAPVLLMLVPAIATLDLPRKLLDEVVDWHARDCEAAPFEDLAQMIAHAKATSGSLMKLAVRVLGAGQTSDEACDHAGVAYGLSRQLQEFAHWASHHRLRLPRRDLEECGIASTDALDANTAGDRLEPVVRTVTAEIVRRLAELNRTRFVRAATPVLAVAALARGVCARSFDPLRPAAMPPWQRVARLSASNLLWRI